jgi:hypothetical protein
VTSRSLSRMRHGDISMQIFFRRTHGEALTLYANVCGVELIERFDGRSDGAC